MNVALLAAARRRGWVRAPDVATAFSRKPSYPTPELPTPLRTFYVDAASGNDSNNGSEGAPFQTIGKINSTAIAGDRFYLKGTFGGTTPLASASAAHGTSTNPVQIVVWPGGSAALNNGGGVNENSPVGPSTRNYWWLKGLTIQAPSGAYGRRGVALTGGASHWRLIDCHWVDSSLVMLGASDNAVYDCSFSGHYGSVVQNSGDFYNISNSSHRNFFCRMHVEGYAYHSAGLVGNVQAGATAAEDNHFFDCYWRNLAAGGPQFLGLANRTLVEWSTIEDSATDASIEHYVGSKDSLQQASPNFTFRYNIVRNGAFRGLAVFSYYFGGWLQRACDGHYYHNVIYGHVGNGLYLYAGAEIGANVDLVNNLFENNIFWNNQLGSANEANGHLNGHWNVAVFNVYNTAYPWTAGTIGNNVMRNNLNARSTGDTRFIGVWKNTSFGQGGNTVYTLADFETTFGSTGNANNLGATDPLFVGALDNFRLQAESPCIDAGHLIDGVDYLGGAPDFGVFEYGGMD